MSSVVKPTIAEVISFDKKADSPKTEADMLAFADTIGQVMAQAEGFVGRYVGVSADGTYLLANLWESQASADTANQGIRGLQAAADFFAEIDMSTFVFRTVTLDTIARDLSVLPDAALIEMVTFNAVPNANEATLVQKAEAMSDAMYTKAGYLARFLGKNTTSGLTGTTQWVIFNYWRDAASNVQGNAELKTIPEALAFGAEIERYVFYKAFTLKLKTAR